MRPERPWAPVLSPRANGAPGRTWKWKQQDCLTCPRNPCKNKKTCDRFVDILGVEVQIGEMSF